MEFIKVLVEHQLSSQEEVLARLKTFSKREETKRLIESRLESWQEKWSGNPGGQFSFLVKGKEDWQVLGETSFPPDSPDKIELRLSLPQIDELDDAGRIMIEDLAKGFLIAILAPAWHQEKKRRVMQRLVLVSSSPSPGSPPLPPEEVLRRLQNFSTVLENRFPDKVNDVHDFRKDNVVRFRFNFWKKLIFKRMAWRVSGMIFVYRHGVHLRFDLLSVFARADEEEFRKAVAAVEETVKSLLRVGS